MRSRAADHNHSSPAGSYANDVPFLARNFGSFGIHLEYDLFDSGRKRGALRERESQLLQAKENLAQVTEEVELAVQTAYNKLDDAELLLMLGTDFPFSEFLPGDGVKKVQIDKDPKHIGRRTPVDLGLVGDIKVTVSALLERVHEKQDRRFLDKCGVTLPSEEPAKTGCYGLRSGAPPGQRSAPD